MTYNPYNLIDESMQMRLTEMNVLSYIKMLQHSLPSEDMDFEWADNFKYLGMKINALSNNYKKIQMRIYMANEYFFALKIVFKL